jgi:hypothetical protein
MFRLIFANTPMVGTFGCCACALSGHATAAENRG